MTYQPTRPSGWATLAVYLILKNLWHIVTHCGTQQPIWLPHLGNLLHHSNTSHPSPLEFGVNHTKKEPPFLLPPLPFLSRWVLIFWGLHEALTCLLFRYSLLFRYYDGYKGHLRSPNLTGWSYRAHCLLANAGCGLFLGLSTEWFLTFGKGFPRSFGAVPWMQEGRASHPPG